MQDGQQTSIFRMWWSYHRKWCRRWVQAVRPSAKENVLGAAAGAIGAVAGWRYGYVAHGKLASAIVIGAVGYGIIFFAYSLWAALFTSSKIDHEQDSTVGGMKEALDTKTQEWIAAKQESVDNMQRDVDTRTQLISVLEELSKARKEAADNSDAFHAEYAKNSKLNEQIAALTFPADRPQLSFHAWGHRESNFMPLGSTDGALMAQHGFYFANDGGAALEVTVEEFEINHLFSAGWWHHF
jgi:hypothetical protein